MDATKEQQAVTDAQANVDSLTTQLNADSATLQDAKDALANINLINGLEGLNSDQVSEINSALSTDSDNKTGVSISLPPATTES